MYFLALPEQYLFHGRLTTVAEHLGYSATDRLLIINADDFGLNTAVNRAVVELFAQSRITSTTIMVPGAAYQDALSGYREQGRISCGIHLALTGDYTDDGSRPVASPLLIPSLLSDEMRLHHDRQTFFTMATPEEAEIEARAQIERALADGIDVTHLDSHEGTLQLQPEFIEVFLRLAADYRLPVRAGSRQLLEQMGIDGNWIDRIRRTGIHITDNLVYMRIDQFSGYSEKEDFVTGLVHDLPPGITEIYFHPSSTLHAADASNSESNQEVRRWDYRLLQSDRLWGIIRDQGIILTDFRPLRDLTRFR
jgi:predicted glycoside hydrolase/deacetylase ChbG (UPF0249 family)